MMAGWMAGEAGQAATLLLVFERAISSYDFSYNLTVTSGIGLAFVMAPAPVISTPEQNLGRNVDEIALFQSDGTATHEASRKFGTSTRTEFSGILLAVGAMSAWRAEISVFGQGEIEFAPVKALVLSGGLLMGRETHAGPATGSQGSGPLNPGWHHLQVTEEPADSTTPSSYRVVFPSGYSSAGTVSMNGIEPVFETPSYFGVLADTGGSLEYEFGGASTSFSIAWFSFEVDMQRLFDSTVSPGYAEPLF